MRGGERKRKGKGKRKRRVNSVNRKAGKERKDYKSTAADECGKVQSV